MGCCEFIDYDKWPEQEDIGTMVRVCFNYDLTRSMTGKIVRNDMSEPYLTIIRLENGRFVLGTECQFAFS